MKQLVKELQWNCGAVAVAKATAVAATATAQ